MKDSRWRHVLISFGAMFLLVQFFTLYTHLDWKKPIMYYQKYLMEETYRNGYQERNVSDNRTQLFPRFSLYDIDPLWSEKVFVSGAQNPIKQKFLTIGFVTARRPNNTIYMFDTLNSLLSNSDESEHRELCIVILIAELDTEWKQNITNRIEQTYPDEIKNGTILIIQSFKWIYPKLDNLKHHYIGHSDLKVSWKAKQNIDFVLLWLYVYKKGLSKYYLHLEDDVITVQGYIQAMADFIENQSRRWTCLEFSQLGMIAKLYHTKDLESLAKIVALFYEEQPADFTYLSFNPLMLQFGRRVRKPTLFQHMGTTSSLKTKTVKAKDGYFIGNMTKTYKGDNPPADITTTFSDKSTSPEVAYMAGFGIYWSSRSPEKDEYYKVHFKKPQKVRRIVVISGMDSHPNDILKNAVLEISHKLNQTKQCTDFEPLGSFKNGVIDINNLTQFSSSHGIHCFQIKLLRRQAAWVIIREIAVFLWRK